ncbi:MAG: hypothetical protein K0R66_1725 [Gammaproteobacteria bacterium]|jgi:hypothetical protein|nr:hypothetical protein [Gammaproteobacteria bacterium]
MTNPMTNAEMLAKAEKIKKRMFDELVDPIDIPECGYIVEIIESLRVRVENKQFDGLSKCCKSEFTVVYDPDRQYECCKCDNRCGIYEDKDHA